MTQMHFVRHEDDEFFDNVVVVVAGAPFLELLTIPRFKTSGLSGDEWRTSVMWRHYLSFFKGTIAKDLDGPYSRLAVACAAIYPGVLTAHPDWHDLPCDRFEFWRKGTKRYETSYGGELLPLLKALGALPWALVQAGESDGGGLPLRQDDDLLCFQPGCSMRAVSTYRLKQRWCNRCGSSREPAPAFDAGKLVPGQEYRRFCRRHLRRGDCGLDDSDANYEIVQGPGPSEAQLGPDDESPAVFGGVVSVPFINPSELIPAHGLRRILGQDGDGRPTARGQLLLGGLLCLS